MKLVTKEKKSDSLPKNLGKQSLNQWLVSNHLNPLVRIILILTIGFLVLESYFIFEQVKEENQMVANIATFCEKGILHQEFDFIMDIFQSSYLRGDIVQAAICKDGKIIGAYPSVFHGDCQFERRWLTRTIEKRPYYLSDYLFIFEIPLVRKFERLVYLSVFFLMGIFLSYWTKLLYRKLKQNLIAPLENLLKFPDKQNQVSHISEIILLQSGFNEYMNMRKSREELKLREEKTKAISQTLSMVAHDIKKPFGMLETVINLIARSKENERKIRFVQSIETDVKQSCLEARSILDHISAYGKSYQRENMDISLNQLILDSCVGVFGSLNSYDWFTAKFKLAHQHCIVGNEIGLKRAFSNIIKNAIEFMKTGDLINFTSSESNGVIRITITNTGSFIPQHLLGKIFEPYVTENKTHGTGLGLAICANIIEQCQGNIWCTTDESVPSASFCMDFKATTVSEPVTPQNVIDFPKLLGPKVEAKDLTERLDKNLFEKQKIIDFLTVQRIRILIVDDEPLCVEVIKRYLRDISPRIEVLVFNKSSEVAVNHDYKIDLAIVDFNLGKEEANGLELIKMLKKNNRDTKYCICSDWIYDVSHYQSVGINYCLAKPISDAHLIKILNKIVSDH